MNSTLKYLLAILWIGSGLAMSQPSIAADDKGRLPDPLEAGWKGKKICENLIEDDRHRVLRCTFPPGGGHDRHHHAPHSGYVIAGGLMRITDARGVREVDIKTGSTWTSDGHAWHEAINIGTSTAQYLIIEIKNPA